MADKDFDYGLPTPGVLGEEPNPNDLVWFSYLTGMYTADTRMHTKRYLSWEDYKEAGDSNFTSFCTRPYVAANREAAVVEGHRLISKSL